jgi:hypothetical protein
MLKSDAPGTVRAIALDDTDSYDARPFKIARSTLDFALREKAVRLHVQSASKKRPPLERGGALQVGPKNLPLCVG